MLAFHLTLILPIILCFMTTSINNLSCTSSSPRRIFMLNLFSEGHNIVITLHSDPCSQDWLVLQMVYFLISAKKNPIGVLTQGSILEISITESVYYLTSNFAFRDRYDQAPSRNLTCSSVVVHKKHLDSPV